MTSSLPEWAFVEHLSKKQLPRLMVVSICLSLAAPAVAHARGNRDVNKDGKPNIKSSSALVIDLATGETLFERDADLVRPLASLSKLAGTLVIAQECNLPPDGLHEMSKSNREAARGGDKSKLTTGWSFSHDDLLHAALMRSDNRALPALGEACGLTPAELGARMTAKVRSLGLTKTTFVEPDGLSPQNVSTAREIMVVLKEVLKVPKLAEIMTTAKYTITAVRDGRRRLINIRNTDRLLSKNMAEIIGGKTGYTDLARYCLAVAARLPDQRRLGMVFMGAEGRFTRFADFGRVVKWLATMPKLSKDPAATASSAMPHSTVENTEIKSADGQDPESKESAPKNVETKAEASELSPTPASP